MVSPSAEQLSAPSLLVRIALPPGIPGSWTRKLAFFAYGDHYVVADLDDDDAAGRWQHPLEVASRVVVEVGGESFTARARRPAGQELGLLRQRWLENEWYGGRFAARERATGRAVPVMVLDREDTYQRKQALNREIIAEFRSNGGMVSHTTSDGLSLAGVPLLLLHHRGRKTGRERVNPLQYRRHGQGFAVMATNGGSLWHPDWYLNLMAAPATVVEVGKETIAVRARTAQGEERDVLLGGSRRPSARSGRYGGYQHFVGREIPVVILERAEQENQ